jgi:hypothetical protein
MMKKETSGVARRNIKEFDHIVLTLYTNTHE